LGPADDEPPRVLLASMIDVEYALRVESPTFDVLVESQRSFDDENGALRDERPILLPRLFEHQSFEAGAAIVQREYHASAALAYVEHPARNRHGLASKAKALVRRRRRSGAGDICNAPAHDRANLRLELFERVAGQIQAERVALAFESHTPAPFGQRLRLEGNRCGRVRGQQTDEIVLTGDSGPYGLSGELDGSRQRRHQRRAVRSQAIRRP